jgi:aspartyl/asparaginyl beta-hydroxylase (cupin superfamily)
MKSAMTMWNQPAFKHVRRFAVIAIVLAPAIYLMPIVTLFIVVCGAIDVSRHRRLRYELIEKYFMGNGIPTWLLSPVNLLADLLSHRNKGQYALEDMPAEHRAEIEACTRAFRENGDVIKAHIAKTIGQNKRCMLTFKWFSTKQMIDLTIPAFDQEYKHIKTIAVSVFNTRERTSWHFGPLRLTFRVLYNLEPIDSKDVYIEVDDRIHYWKDGPLFIFDDTMFHQSVNDVDQVRHCLFMDIVRPNHFAKAFEVGLNVVNVVSGSFKRVFYQNWSFVR